MEIPKTSKISGDDWSIAETNDKPWIEMLTTMIDDSRGIKAKYTFIKPPKNYFSICIQQDQQIISVTDILAILGKATTWATMIEVDFLSTVRLFKVNRVNGSASSQTIQFDEGEMKKDFIWNPTKADLKCFAILSDAVFTKSIRKLVTSIGRELIPIKSITGYVISAETISGGIAIVFAECNRYTNDLTVIHRMLDEWMISIPKSKFTVQVVSFRLCVDLGKASLRVEFLLKLNSGLLGSTAAILSNEQLEQKKKRLMHCWKITTNAQENRGTLQEPLALQTIPSSV